jgi:DNA replication protein DnaC
MSEQCRICGGEGWLKSPLGLVLCKCAVERKIASRVPALYKEARLTDFQEEIQSFVVGNIANSGAGILISGPVGSGKTRLAAAVVRHLIESGVEALFVTAERFFAKLRETLQTGASEESVFSEFVGVPFLVLDDLGAGSLSDHERRSALALLDRRMNAKRPTIATTNWDLQRIADLMDDRIASRLSEFEKIELGGRDWRSSKPAA